MANTQNVQVMDGLKTRWVEQCTSIADVMRAISVQGMNGFHMKAVAPITVSGMYIHTWATIKKNGGMITEGRNSGMAENYTKSYKTERLKIISNPIRRNGGKF